MMVGT